MLVPPGLPYGTLFRSPPAPALPVPFDRPGVDLWLRGSTALWRGLQLVAPRPGDAILFPAYHCALELAVVLKAGFRADFYDVGPDLRVDVDELRRRARPDVRALYVIHYFGQSQPLGDLQRLCAERGWLLIEDCAHALLARGEAGPAGTTGDIAIFSPHKTLPLPSAGVLRINTPTPDRPPRTRRPPAGFAVGAILDVLGRDVVRSGAMRPAVCRRLLGAMSQRFRGRAASNPAVIDFPARWEAAGAPWLTGWLLRRTCRVDVPRRRRANFSALLDVLAACRGLRPLVSAVAPGDCPTVFPVLPSGGDTERFIEFCWQRGVRSSRFWPVFHPALPMDRHAEVVRLKRQTVILPVHHELGEEDMALLTRVILEWEHRGG